jgi:hypothetical protein
MESRETNAREQAAEGLAPVQLLPYRSPSLVEYGNVSKLTEGGHGSMADNATMVTHTCL